MLHLRGRMLLGLLDIGSVTGSEGELILKDGALHNCIDTYVGGGMGVPGRAALGSLIIQGGSHLGRTLILGAVLQNLQSLQTTVQSKPVRCPN